MSYPGLFSYQLPGIDAIPMVIASSISVRLREILAPVEAEVDHYAVIVFLHCHSFTDRSAEEAAQSSR
jgi:hypothetical protein